MGDIKEKYKLLEFKEFGDERGSLVVAEGGGDIPFEIKRVFYMYGSDSGIIRGRHANRHSEFVLINVAGTSKVRLDDGFQTEVVELNKPRMGLYMAPMIWKDMYDFSPDSVLLCLSSRHYDADEYIRNYDEFTKEVRK
ncbi:MAG: FdtA/QdtA family cupin domain-containing protein [Lachnospiraceae bacterium]|nr:FdtA/QdtA family cupin domain-containing protein [Lachnospiraceae bacterium]